MTETINQETDLQKEKTLEEAFEKLGELAERLEDSETSLEDSFRFYKEGMELLKYCSEKLDTVEKKCSRWMKMEHYGNFKDETEKTDGSCGRSDPPLASRRKRFCQNHGRDNELQYVCRRQASAPGASSGVLPAF